jgi:hypothetical protein
MYGHIRCIYKILANSTNNARGKRCMWRARCSRIEASELKQYGENIPVQAK